MPKKGSLSTHRVRYEWSNGIKGVVACFSKDEAVMKAQEIMATAARRDDITLTISIEEVLRADARWYQKLRDTGKITEAEYQIALTDTQRAWAKGRQG